MSEFKLVSEPFLDSDQAAAILRIHPKTLQRLSATRSRHRLPCRQAVAISPPPTLKAGMIASLPHSTPTLPSGTL